MSPLEHHAQWNDELQDRLDGIREPVFETHLRDCALCQKQLAALERLDAALAAASRAPSLSAAFDERLLARIGALDETQRLAARRQAEAELARQLQTLSRDGRRALTLVLPGMIGGIALAFAFTSDSSGLTGRLAARLLTEGGVDPGTLQAALTWLLGASVGGAVSGWLAKAVN